MPSGALDPAVDGSGSCRADHPVRQVEGPDAIFGPLRDEGDRSVGQSSGALADTLNSRVCNAPATCAGGGGFADAGRSSLSPGLVVRTGQVLAKRQKVTTSQAGPRGGATRPAPAACVALDEITEGEDEEERRRKEAGRAILRCEAVLRTRLKLREKSKLASEEHVRSKAASGGLTPMDLFDSGACDCGEPLTLTTKSTQNDFFLFNRCSLTHSPKANCSRSDRLAHVPLQRSPSRNVKLRVGPGNTNSSLLSEGGATSTSGDTRFRVAGRSAHRTDVVSPAGRENCGGININLDQPADHLRTCTSCRRQRHACDWPIGQAQCNCCARRDSRQGIRGRPCVLASFHPGRRNDLYRYTEGAIDQSRPVKVPEETITETIRKWAAVSGKKKSDVDSRRARSSKSLSSGHGAVRTQIALLGNSVQPSIHLIERLKREMKLLANERHSFAQTTLVRNTCVLAPTKYIQRDHALISQLIRGKMRRFSISEWQDFLCEWERKVQTFVDGFKACRLFIRSVDNASPVDVDLDQHMSSRHCDGIFIHDDCQVLFATLSPHACSKIRNGMAAQIGVNPIPNAMVVSGANEALCRDRTNERSTKGNKCLRCISFGSSTRPQHHNHKSYARIVGSRRCTINCSGIKLALRHSFEKQIREFYRKRCYPVFFGSSIKGVDKFYGSNPDRPSRKPRIAKTGSMDTSTCFRLPYVRMSSAPSLAKNKLETVVATCYESNSCRALAEELCSGVFGPLPYCLANVVGHLNECNFFLKKGMALSEAGFSRPFPQGTIGLRHNKSLHDDGNAAIMPGLWQCVQADPDNPVYLQFTTSSARWRISSDTGRFAMIKGLIPHETKLRKNMTGASRVQRISHSSYWKLEHEYVALALMAPENCKDLIA